jgi:hypothetical protein
LVRYRDFVDLADIQKRNFPDSGSLGNAAALKVGTIAIRGPAQNFPIEWRQNEPKTFRCRLLEFRLPRNDIDAGFALIPVVNRFHFGSVIEPADDVRCSKGFADADGSLVQFLDEAKRNRAGDTTLR